MSKRLLKIYYGMSACGVIIGGLALTRSYLNGSKYEGTEELYGKTVIITGANRGIGKETARDLAKRGARVIMACRDMKLCEKAREDIVWTTFNKNLECVECDLASLKSIRAFVDKINEKEKSVDILVNNAGVMWCPKGRTKEGFETHLGVNFLGHFYLTNLLLPKLKESKPSRVVILGSRDYQKGTINFEDLNLSADGAYSEERAHNQSKLATVIFASELARRLGADSGVTVNCVDPGYVQTDLMRHSSVHRSPYSPVSFLFKLVLKTPEIGAQQVVYVCLWPRFAQISGKYIRNFQEIPLDKVAHDEQLAKRLWATAEKWTRLK